MKIDFKDDEDARLNQKIKYIAEKKNLFLTFLCLKRLALICKSLLLLLKSLSQLLTDEQEFLFNY